MPKLLFAGTFDPPTIGHLDLIRRAREVGHVTVGVFVNPEKECLFSPEERAAMLRAATAAMEGVDVIVDRGYTADYAKAGGYTHLVRGYRNEEDLAYEQKMAAYNLARGGIETLLLPTDPALAEVSSTRVRAALTANDTEALACLVPAACLAYMERLNEAHKQ